MYFGEYVSVADQRKRAQKDIAKLRKKGENVQPIVGFQGAIAKSFWGKKWCENLEYYADALYRLDRGRRYIRAGSICHLAAKGRDVEAVVSGTSLYRVKVAIAPIDKNIWTQLCQACSTNIASLVELMSGKLDKEVMDKVCDVDTGLFPKLNEISFRCSCPDSASMCKHVAATMYGIGRKLDDDPALIFQLRGVKPMDMISITPANNMFDVDATLAAGKLEDIFGIELDAADCALATAPGAVKAP